MESLEHNHDVLALAVAPTGRVAATATLDGQLYLWNVADGELIGTIEGRRDIGGGRGLDDKRSAVNRDAGVCTCSNALLHQHTPTVHHRFVFAHPAQQEGTFPRCSLVQTARCCWRVVPASTSASMTLQSASCSDASRFVWIDVLCHHCHIDMLGYHS